MKRRIILSPQALVALVSTYVVFTLNGAFWSRLIAIPEHTNISRWSAVLVIGTSLLALTVAVLSLLAVPYVLKPVAILLVLTSASTAYFLSEYGVVIDTNMVRNVLQTDPAEAGDLIGPKFMYSVALWGALPAVLIWVTAVAWQPMSQTIAANARMILLSLGPTAAMALTMQPLIHDAVGTRKDLQYVLVPYNVIMATTRFLRSKEPWLPKVVRPFGEDAHRALDAQVATRRLVTVLVIGETARAANFSLLGYGRPTNPRLSGIDGLLSFRHVTSCGTDTAHSVPCIFSGLGRDRFSSWKAASQENLLDIVQRAGLAVLWRENQGGCKGVCRRTPTENLARAGDKRFCASRECFDEILLDGLDEQIVAMKDGGIIVLHMMGSHGPSYHSRVPAEFRVFRPTCDTREIRSCSIASLMNTYDNTIVYSDYVLAKLIVVLGSLADRSVDTSMIYVSDHGESLGESGAYLHGAPYFMAPKEQTHVPLLMWMAPSTQARLGVDFRCLDDLAKQAHLSHDNIFHSVLGIHAIETRTYDRSLDIFAPCRGHKRGPI